MKRLAGWLVPILVAAVLLTGSCAKKAPEEPVDPGKVILEKLPEHVKQLIVPGLKVKEPVTIADINMSLENEYYLTLNKMYRLLGAVYGAKVKSYSIDWKVEKQWEAIEDALAAGVKGVVTCPAETPAGEAMFARLKQAGIPAVCDILDFSHVGVPSFGQSNYDANFAAGQWVGDYVNEHFGGVAKVVILHFGRRHQSTIDRERGFMDGLKSKVKQVVVLAEEDGGAVMDQSMDKMEHIITRVKDFNVVWGVNDPTALGALAAVEAAGYKPDQVIIAGFDASSDFLDALKRGSSFKVSPGIDPIATAAKEMEILVRMINGEKVEVKYYSIPIKVITAENADEWKQYRFDWWKDIEPVIPK